MVYISQINGAGTRHASAPTMMRPDGLRFLNQSETKPPMTTPRKPPAAPQPPRMSATISLLAYQGSGPPAASSGAMKVRMA